MVISLEFPLRYINVNIIVNICVREGELSGICFDGWWGGAGLSLIDGPGTGLIRTRRKELVMRALCDVCPGGFAIV